MQSSWMRKKLLTIRMGPDEMMRLDFLAKHYGITAAGVVRMLLKREETAVRAAEGYAPTYRSIVELVFAETGVTDDRVSIALNMNRNRARNHARYLSNEGIIKAKTMSGFKPGVLGGVMAYEPKFDSISETIEAMAAKRIDPDERFEKETAKR